jgi:hypothetical protein
MSKTASKPGSRSPFFTPFTTPNRPLDPRKAPPGAFLLHPLSHVFILRAKDYVILNSRDLLTVDGETLEVSMGDVILNKPKDSHGLVNNSQAYSQILVFEIKV